MNKTTKTYDFNNGYAIDCSTYESNGKKKYEIEVVLTSVPWRDVLEHHTGDDPKTFNDLFKVLASKYKKLDGLHFSK